MVQGHFEACALRRFWASLLPAAVVEVAIVICLKSLITFWYCTITTHPLGKPREAKGVSVGCCLWGCPGNQIPPPRGGSCSAT